MCIITTTTQQIRVHWSFIPSQLPIAVIRATWGVRASLFPSWARSPSTWLCWQIPEESDFVHACKLHVCAWVRTYCVCVCNIYACTHLGTYVPGILCTCFWFWGAASRMLRGDRRGGCCLSCFVQLSTESGQMILKGQSFAHNTFTITLLTYRHTDHELTQIYTKIVTEMIYFVKTTFSLICI